jgi:hypothetical protein
MSPCADPTPCARIFPSILKGLGEVIEFFAIVFTYATAAILAFD